MAKLPRRSKKSQPKTPEAAQSAEPTKAYPALAQPSAKVDLSTLDILAFGIVKVSGLYAVAKVRVKEGVVEHLELVAEPDDKRTAIERFKINVARNFIM